MTDGVDDAVAINYSLMRSRPWLDLEPLLYSYKPGVDVHNLAREIIEFLIETSEAHVHVRPQLAQF